jgi:hypothetical protein
VIVLAVRWYLRFGLSYRDIEELLAERGVQVDHVSVFRWVQRFTPLLAGAARWSRHAIGSRWHADETPVTAVATASTATTSVPLSRCTVISGLARRLCRASEPVLNQKPSGSHTPILVGSAGGHPAG